MRFVAAILLALAAGPALAQTLPATSACPVEPSPAAPALEAALKLVNDFRAQNGVAPLKLNPLLTKAAQAHADDMAAHNYFSHSSRDGRSPGDRINATGYRAMTWGENIAWGQPDWASAIRAWMNSSGHRRNMLSAAFKEMGLGTKDRRWVQVFATPR
jgi:uncharacterized protein YkwD